MIGEAISFNITEGVHHAVQKCTILKAHPISAHT